MKLVNITSEQLERLLQDVYDAAFAGTSEGYNAEYPYYDEFKENNDYKTNRDNTIATVIEEFTK